MGEYNSVLIIVKEIKESEHMFTIAHSLPSALPWPNFSQVSLLPTDPRMLLGPSLVKNKAYLVSFSWESADCRETLIVSDPTGHFQFSHQSFCLSVLVPVLLYIRKNPCSVWIWDGYRFLKLEQSSYCNIYFFN